VPLNSRKNKYKIILLVQCAYLGLAVGLYNPTPLDIYNTGFYRPEQRGREEKAAQVKLRHHHMGLMKPHMPLIPGDIAISDEVFPYLKPSDKSSFTEDAAWVEYNFARMVHPFSNSISGTMLTQLRSCAYLKQKRIETFAYSETDMSQFCKLYISALLFNAGGHSLFEFSAPLFLSEVKQEFKFKTMSLKSMFFDNNEAAFNAISYIYFPICLGSGKSCGFLFGEF
jgi:hypothetical protein